jgi:L-aspartate oxidase
MFPRYLINFNLREIDEEYVDFLVIGSGLAGLYVAFNLARYGRVLMLSKITLLGGSSYYAQGGIAAALGEKDSPACHYKDTIKAGAGLCNKRAVKILVREGPRHVRELIRLGAPFDCKDEKLNFSIEGAHSRPRVIHAGGDTTGREICKTLITHVNNSPNITIMEQVMAVDLLTSHRRCKGALVINSKGGLLAVHAGAVVIATGGIGQIYRTTTNPAESTGDGIAMALRAGAALMNMEFIQFHPTALDHPAAGGFLISEAVRGEGAVLRNSAGEQFMQSYHPAAELAPRDIVARGIHEQIFGAGEKVYLDATGFAAGHFKIRFPSIWQRLIDVGLDPEKTWIPVSPAAHYLMGGILTDTWGRTKLRGLYACGETACSGVNGANRLASNSLLECLVYGARTARAAATDWVRPGKPAHFAADWNEEVELNEEECAIQDQKLRSLMEQHAGIVRNTAGLKKATAEILAMAAQAPLKVKNHTCLELQNKIVTAHAVVSAALARNKSCGAHYRSDGSNND